MSFNTPFTRSGLTQYDSAPDIEAIFLAWMRPGQDPAWHDRCREEVRDRMPLLARALDRYCERVRMEHAQEDFMKRVDKLRE